MGVQQKTGVVERIPGSGILELMVMLLGVWLSWEKSSAFSASSLKVTALVSST
jgi:hypothetical protein